MQKAPLPVDEVRRLAAVQSLHLLDTPPEERFDRICRMARQVLDVPIALLSLVDADRQWVKACQGLTVAELPRAVSFCAQAILGSDVLIIPDTDNDPRFSANPLVRADPRVRFYAGCPLAHTDGSNLGTLCVLDYQPRMLDAQQCALLRDLAAWAERELTALSTYRALTVWQQSESRMQQQTVLADLSQQALVGNAWDDLLEQASVQLIRMLAVEYACILEYTPDGTSLHMRSGEGWAPGTVGAIQLPIIPGSQAHYLLHATEPFILNALAEETRFAPHPFLMEHRVVGGMSVAIRGPQRPCGLLEVYTTRPHTFTLYDTHLLRTVANVLALAFKRHRCEAAWRASEQRFQDVLNASGEYIWEVDREGRYTFLSERVETVLGYPRTAMLGQSSLAFLPPDEAAQMITWFRTTGASHYPFRDLYHRSMHQSGQTVWLRVSGMPMHDTTGAVVGYRGTSLDITEQKAAEEAQHANEARLRAIISNAPIVLYTIDSTGVITFSQGKGLEAWGFHSSELVGVPVFERFDHLPEILADIRRALAGEAFTSIRDAGNITFQFWYTPLHDEQGRVTGTIGVSADVTERRHVERALEEARAVAEAAVRTKSAFLANMSHEIRTPLHAVIGLTRLLLETDLTPEQYDLAQTIRASGDALLAIVNDILDFSKMEANKLRLEQQPFDLHACIEAALDLLAPKAAEKRLNLAYQVDEHVPCTLIGDSGRLRQVLVNLLSNAVKFTDTGEVTVQVTGVRCRQVGGRGLRTSLRKAQQPTSILAARQAQLGDAANSSVALLEADGFEPALGTDPRPPLSDHWMVQFSVNDTGIGIPAEHIAQLFQSFTQGDAATSRKYGGTGLGLAISKRLVEMMGGTITVESEVGRGATFTFTILSRGITEQRPPHLQGNQPTLVGKRVLIVEDNATNRSILGQQATRWGMLPYEAASGSEALTWLHHSETCDVVILAIDLPDMDGLALAVAIQEQQWQRHLPVILLAAVGAYSDTGGIAKKYIAASLTQPIKLAALHAALVNAVLHQPGEHSRPPSRPPRLPPETPAAHLPLRILLAEDSPVNQKIALSLLGQLGYHADVVDNGQAVLAALERQPYDVVLMDIYMPEMDGIAATQHIAERWPAAERPTIIALTANLLDSEREQYYAVGMDDYVSKPLVPDDLAAVLKRCAEKRRKNEATGQSATETPPPPPRNWPHRLTRTFSVTFAPCSTMPTRHS